MSGKIKGSVYAHIATKVMDVLVDEGVIQGIFKGTDDEAFDTLEKITAALTAVSGRVGAMYLLRELNQGASIEDVESHGQNFLASMSANLDLSMAGELEKMIELTNGIALDSDKDPTKPTSH